MYAQRERYSKTTEENIELILGTVDKLNQKEFLEMKRQNFSKGGLTKSMLEDI